MNLTKMPVVAAMLAAARMACADTAHFQPGQLAVLQAGDGVVKQHLKQAPIFVDQFDPKTFNDAPSYQVAIPTNGAGSLFFNGHAATEGGLSRSADHKLLVFAGYGGVSLLEQAGTPSLLDIQRGFCTVDASGGVKVLLYQPDSSDDKMNPRGGVSDGENHFWGCGNAGATLFLNPAASKTPVQFDAVPNTRAMKIINHTLYATLNGPDAVAAGTEPGIYEFTDAAGNPASLPQPGTSKISLVVPVSAPYVKIAGFDLSPDKTVAYVADVDGGIEKYVKSGQSWKLACNFAIPQNIPKADNHAAGCFAVAADFSGPAPVIFATTTEGYNGTVNSNRVVRITDTNATAVVSTVAQSPSDNIAFRGIDFTPEAGR
jgi:hypothetical protein